MLECDIAQCAVERIEKKSTRPIEEAFIFPGDGKTDVVFRFPEGPWRHYTLAPTTTVVHKVSLTDIEAEGVVRRFGGRVTIT